MGFALTLGHLYLCLETWPGAHETIIPLIRKELLSYVDSCGLPLLPSAVSKRPSVSDGSLCQFVDMPLLFETGSDKWFSKSLLVACKESAQVRLVYS